MSEFWNAFWPLAAGYGFGILAGWVFIERVITVMQQREGYSFYKDPTIRGGRFLPRELGLLERALYIGAVQAAHAEFIAVWLALKVAGQWRGWSDTVPGERGQISGRTVFSIFLIGSGLSVAYAVVGAKMIQWASSSDYAKLLIVPIALICGSEALRILARRSRHPEPEDTGV